MTDALILKDIQKSFIHVSGTVKAVDTVSLSLRENEFFTLLGPSGCGKTTLLRLIAGLETAESGEIILNNQDITQLPAHKRPVNTVFQSYALFPHMTVTENVGFGLKMQKQKNITNTVKDALRLVRMEELADRKPAQLSGGQQQRVALARALVNRPKMLLLDEPLSALDFKLRREMQTELKHLQRETGITFIFVTHDQDEALSMSDRIAVMDHGKIAQLGTPQEIYDRPATRFVASFVGTCNFVKPEALGLKGDAEIGFRSEDASFNGNSPYSVPGKIIGIHYRGAVTHYMVQLDGDTVVTVASNAASDVKEGMAVRIFIDPKKVMRWDN